MQSATIRHWVIAFIPLIFLLSLTGLFYNLTQKYVWCSNNRCISVVGTLGLVLIDGAPYTLATRPGDSSDVLKTRKIETANLAAQIYSGRMTTLFLAATYFLVCVIAAGFACLVITRMLKHSRMAVFVPIGLSIAGGVCLYYFPQSYMTILKPLFEQTISRDLPDIQEIWMRLNSFGFAAVFLLTFAICAILYQSNSKSHDLKELSIRMKYLRSILYVGTLMLVLGVLLIRSAYQWSTAFLLSDAASAKAAQTFFSGLLTVEGGYFTLILAAVYLPAAFILRKRAESLAGLPESEADKEKVLQDNNLAFSLTQSLPKIAAILSPVLAGWFGEMFSRIT